MSFFLRGVAHRVVGDEGGVIINKNIMLPISMFVDVYRLIYLLDDYVLDHDTRTVVKRLEEALTAKVEAMNKRDAYTEYKTAIGDEAKEAARQKYLDLAGIHRDWRWGAEAELRRKEL